MGMVGVPVLDDTVATTRRGYPQYDLLTGNRFPRRREYGGALDEVCAREGWDIERVLRHRERMQRVDDSTTHHFRQEG